MNNKLIDKIFDKFKELNLYYNTYDYPITSRDKFTIRDNLGYKYFNSYNGLLKNYKRKSKMDKVSKWNPYSIENIRLYCSINIPSLSIESNEFVSAKTKLKFKCNICGEVYATWDDLNHGNGCPKCNLRIKHTDEVVINRIKDFSDACGIRYSWIDGDYIRAGVNSLILQDDIGYKYITSYNVLDSHMGCKLSNFDYRNPYIIENIKLFLKIYKPEIELISDKIKGNMNDNRNKVTFYCKKHNLYYKYALHSILHTVYNGCCKCSKIPIGERRVEEYFSKNNINYVFQKTFDNLVGVNNGKLSYDFYLPQNNLLIEYQGQQHEKPISYFGGEEQFKVQQEHDKRKKEYAKLHNIELLEIWYKDLNHTDEILDKYFTL